MIAAVGGGLTQASGNRSKHLRKVLVGAMEEKLFNLFQFVTAGLAWWFHKYSNDRSLGMLEQEARIARRGIWSHENPMPRWAAHRLQAGATTTGFLYAAVIWNARLQS